MIMSESQDLWRSFEELLKGGGVAAWLLALIGAMVLTGLVKGAFRSMASRLRGITQLTASEWDDFLVDGLARTKGWAIFVWIFYPLLQLLEPNKGVVKFAGVAVVVVTVAQVALWGLAGIRYWKDTYLKKRVEQDMSSAAAIGLLVAAVQGLFLITIVLIGLSHLGVDIAALLAGLGVGGIAVALAAQNVLGDLLASLSIVLDKPFVIGDFIVVGSELGTVEHIGIKTTRVRSLSGEELVFSNKDLLESRIRNYKRMWERRVVQKFGVVYSTPAEVLEKIPVWVKDFISRHPKLRFDRCHFSQYGDSSLDFEMVFWVTDPEYNTFMDLQEKVLLEIFKKFNAEGIDFAFPTQTLHIESAPWDFKTAAPSQGVAAPMV